MTKIDIFSGFLGAGKTTLIKKLITEAFAGQQVELATGRLLQHSHIGGADRMVRAVLCSQDQ